MWWFYYYPKCRFNWQTFSVLHIFLALFFNNISLVSVRGCVRNAHTHEAIIIHCRRLKDTLAWIISFSLRINGIGNGNCNWNDKFIWEFYSIFIANRTATVHLNDNRMIHMLRVLHAMPRRILFIKLICMRIKWMNLFHCMQLNGNFIRSNHQRHWNVTIALKLPIGKWQTK